MSYDSLVNQGDYLSPHYLAEVLPRDLKSGLLARWKDEQYGSRQTPQQGVRALGKAYFADRATLAAGAEEFNRLERLPRNGAGAGNGDGDGNGIGSVGGVWESGPRGRAIWRKALHELHGTVLRALAYQPVETTLTVSRAGREHAIPVFHAEPDGTPHIVAVECGWATNTDAALDPDGAGRLLEPIVIDPRETITTGSALATFLFSCQDPPRYVLLLAGGVVTLADRHAWGEGRYLSVSLDTALARRDTSPAGELDLIAALFSADALNPPVEGGTEPLAELVGNSHQHAVGVSSELRDGLRDSVELIANEVLDRIRQGGVHPDEIQLDPRNGEPTELARALTRESLRYLYRILFLLYAEARPDLGILPSDHPEYAEGYGLGRLGELVLRGLASEEARNGFHLYESLDLLFRMVNHGHRPRGTSPEPPADRSEGSASEGIRFEPLRSDLFEPDAIRLIGRATLENPRFDIDGDGPAASGQPRYLDTRLRNATLYRVLRLLMLTKSKSHRKGDRGGFISYAQLGINQLGAVYEGLMSYTGFIAGEELYEVAKGGDPTGGSWMVPASRISEYPDDVFVYETDEETGRRRRVRYAPGSFVYRLAGRDRQTSASYYTPESLTKVTVQLALQHRMQEETPTPKAADLLTWRICEPALGSGAFLNEAINQVAAKYLELREQELGEPIPTERRENELRKVKAYLALHNSYGVDLNATAVELAEVSLWLNVMHPGLQAPWFGLHLRRGNSLIGAGRRVYDEQTVRKGDWLNAAPTDCPMTSGAVPAGSIHHFLLPAAGWGAVAGEKEARELAPEAAKQLAAWRRKLRKAPSTKKPRGKKASQLERLQALAGRAEYLWGLVTRRLEISEREVSRRIEVWGAEGLPEPAEAVPREKVLKDLRDPGTPFWRLKVVMDAWCALWFWPVDGAVTPRDLDDWIEFAEAALGRSGIGEQTIASEFERLADLEPFEKQLESWMGMDSPVRLDSRFPWFESVQRIAEEQGFFHWELEFAQVFGRGGFDLQMGNPPWVKSRWKDAPVLAELDPWFMLSDNAAVNVENERKAAALTDERGLGFFLAELANHAGEAEFLGSSAIYSLLAGIQTDLYHAFMIRAWTNLGKSGIAGLVHPDTHLSGASEGKLRGAAYRRLRIHADFMNAGNRFFKPPVSRTLHFGLHIYGVPGPINFAHLSWIFDTTTLIRSLAGEVGGYLPGVKYLDDWDLRPHSARVITVNHKVLAQWRGFFGESDTPVDEVRLLYPVTEAEQPAIAALGEFSPRLGSLNPQSSSGYHERGAKDAGLIRWHVGDPGDWTEVILQGPHIAVATPFFKQAPHMRNSDRPQDSSDRPQDLTLLPEDAIPRTFYQRSVDIRSYEQAQTRWFDNRRYTEFYRIAWRAMIASNTDRSLFVALIPPGPTHIHGLVSIALPSNHHTALVAGFWATLPLDYLVRTSGRANLNQAAARAIPCPERTHPLSSSLMLRTLRLNCLTNAYAPLWNELYDDRWRREQWALEWQHIARLGKVESYWSWDIPLRTEMERRAALVELDALVAVWLELEAEDLVAIYRSRFPVLSGYEDKTYFDANGRRLAANSNAYGHGQTKDHYKQLIAHLASPPNVPPPEGYTPPFYKVDREKEMREAHAVFSARLKAATS